MRTHWEKTLSMLSWLRPLWARLSRTTSNHSSISEVAFESILAAACVATEEPEPMYEAQTILSSPKASRAVSRKMRSLRSSSARRSSALIEGPTLPAIDSAVDTAAEVASATEWITLAPVLVRPGASTARKEAAALTEGGSRLGSGRGDSLR